MVLWNSDAGFKAWPTRKWMHNADQNMFELWPVPDASAASNNAIVRLRGTKTVTKMINDSDESHAAGQPHRAVSAVEILQRDSAKDAALKLQQGERGDAPASRAAVLHKKVRADRDRRRRR